MAIFGLHHGNFIGIRQIAERSRGTDYETGRRGPIRAWPRGLPGHQRESIRTGPRDPADGRDVSIASILPEVTGMFLFQFQF